MTLTEALIFFIFFQQGPLIIQLLAVPRYPGTLLYLFLGHLGRVFGPLGLA